MPITCPAISCSSVCRPSRASTSARAVSWVATTRAWQSTTSSAASRTPASRSPVTSRPATCPSTTAMPRAASCSRCSSSGLGTGSAGRASRSRSTAATAAPGARPAVRWPGRRWPGRGPPSRGSTGSAARRGPTARPGPGRSGSSSTRPVVTSSRCARTDDPSSRVDQESTVRPCSTAVTVPVTISPPYPITSARPAASSWSGRHALAAQVGVHALGRCVARLTRVDHQDRAAGPGQRQRPAQAGGAATDDHHVVLRLPRRFSPRSIGAAHCPRRQPGIDKLLCRIGKGSCHGSGRRAQSCRPATASTARRARRRPWRSCRRAPASRSAPCRAGVRPA